VLSLGGDVTITVVSQMRVRDSMVNADYQPLQTILDGTRGFDGCQRLDLLIDQVDRSKVVLVVQWESDAHYDVYRAWRAGAGASGLGALFAEPSVVGRYTPA
jgi:quinol monooxygenase YgiN